MGDDIDAIRALFAADQPIAVLAGAGVSLDTPSSLLDGRRFVNEVLAHAVPKGERVGRLVSLLDRPKGRLSRPGEYLRFEILMMCLAQSGLDPDLHVLDCLDQCDRPNRNHFVLATLLHRGCVVMTTNFDRLIELAYERLNPGDWPPLTVAVFEEEFPEALVRDPLKPTLWKLHGSLSRNGVDTRSSVRATMTAVLATRGRQRYRRFLTSVLAAYDLLVVGYSGADDLDIVPYLGDAISSRRMLWVDHRNGSSVTVRSAAEIQKSTDVHWELDAVGRDRLWFTLWSDGEQSRDPANILVVSTPTSNVVDALDRVYGEPASFPLHAQPFSAPGYFAAWRASLQPPESARYAFLLTVTEYARRPWVARARRRWERQRRRLQASRSATPAETVTSLIDEYNDLAKAIARAGSARQFEPRILRIKTALEKLTNLPAELEAKSYRLFGCLAYQLDDAMHGEVFFRLAATSQRKCGDEIGELDTLRTWRRVKDNAAARGVFAPAVYQGPDGERYLLVQHDPSAHRISELVDRTGFLTAWWKDMIEDRFASFGEATDRIWFLSTIQRHSIDVGDTWGEALCAQKLALELCAQHDGVDAFEQLWRLEQLARLHAPAQQLLIEARVEMPLSGCELQLPPDTAARLRRALEASMWSGSDRGRSWRERCARWLGMQPS